jgi:hypothetical protein
MWIACFKFATDPRNVFFPDRKFAFSRRQPFLGQTTGIGTAQTRSRKFCALLW